MAKGSIRFDNGINVEVAVDPSQAVGAKLLNAVNLADGQELSGGGNPNSVQVITGTLDNPWGVAGVGEVNPDTLVAALNSNNANAIVEVNGTTLGFGIVNCSVEPLDDHFHITACNVKDDSASAFEALYDYTEADTMHDWSLIMANALILRADDYPTASITNLDEYASTIPTTLTIYWHPMPEAEGE